MTLAIIILLCAALIISGAMAPKPVGWVVVALSTLALLPAVLGGGVHLSIG